MALLELLVLGGVLVGERARVLGLRACVVAGFGHWIRMPDPAAGLLKFPSAPFTVFAGEPDFHAQTLRTCTPIQESYCS